jgi:hypothetical protein
MDGGRTKVAGVTAQSAARQARPYKRILLNVSPSLHERLRTLAERERRPMTTQIQILLERALAGEPKEVVAA